MATEEEEIYQLCPGVALRPDAPMYLSASEFGELAILASNWDAVLRESSNIRQIVLETWLLVDFSVRLLLAGGLGFTKFSTKEIDLRYDALPVSFPERMTLLKGLFVGHRDVPDIPDRSLHTMKVQFAYWLVKKHRGIVEELSRLENEYCAEKGLPKPHRDRLTATNVAEYLKPLPDQPSEKLPAEWINVAARLDDAWFEGCRRLNSARNVAAHSADASQIARRFGLTGRDVTELVRDECRRLTDVLVGLITNESKDRGLLGDE